MKRIALFLVSALAVAFLVAAGEPIQLGDQTATRENSSYARVMGQGGTNITSITAGTTSCLESGPGQTTCAVFGWGSVVTVQVSQPGTCCWSEDPTLSLGTQGAETAAALGGSTRGCTGKVFQVGGESHDMMPEMQNFNGNGVGGTTRYCTEYVKGPHGVNLYPGCEPTDNADCTAYSGTSVCSAGSQENAGLYLLCDLTANGFVSYVAER